jgi:hypothetical protein
MLDSSRHLGDPDALQAILARHGYLYLPGAIPVEAIDWVRGQMIAAIAEEGLLGSEALDAHARCEIDTRWTGLSLPGVGIPGRQAQAGFKQRRIWETFVEMPGVRSRFDAIMGGPVNFLPISEFRTAAPQSRTPLHQDGAANYGFGVHTAWFPVMPIGDELGGVAVLPWDEDKSHSALQETIRWPQEVAADPGWARAQYRPGDMVVFEGSIMHCGLINRSPDRLRMSMEIRFNGPTAPQPVIGRILSIDADRVTVASNDGVEATFAIDDETRMRGDRITGHFLISRTELAGSDLAPGFEVIVGHEAGRALSVRGIF